MVITDGCSFLQPQNLKHNTKTDGCSFLLPLFIFLNPITIIMLIPKYPMCSNFTLFLNKKVGFKIPTKRYHKNSILCGTLQSGTTKWTSGVVWSFGHLGV